MSSPNFIHVTEADFQYEVILYSQQVPVVVDFWAEWCQPCRILDPILKQLVEENAGAFRLAKLNVDENPNLAMKYNVRGIPSVKAFRDGEVVAEFTGAQPETRVREFLRDVVPSPADLSMEKGKSLLEMEEWKQATSVYEKILEERPEEQTAILGLARSLIPQGRGRESLKLINRMTTTKEYAIGQKLLPLAKAIADYKSEKPRPDDPLDATYKHSLRLISIGNLPAALDGLLDILRQDKNYRDDEVRRIVLGIFEILGSNHPTTREYRKELASALF